MFSNSCSVRKRSSSSSGLMPASRRRKTLRISSSSKTIDVFDCSPPIARASRELLAEAGEPGDRAELDDALAGSGASRRSGSCARARAPGAGRRARRARRRRAAGTSRACRCRSGSRSAASSSAGPSSRSVAVSTTVRMADVRAFDPNQRWSRTKSIRRCSSVIRASSSSSAGTRRSRAAPSSAGTAARRCAGRRVRPNISSGDHALPA